MAIQKTPRTATVQRTRADDIEIARQLEREIGERKIAVPPTRRETRSNTAKKDDQLAVRLAFTEPTLSDPFAFERVLGESDLLSINFLDRGRRSAAAVCRISIPMDGGRAYGTGFLVGPRLLITNNHVISNVAEANQAKAEFEYEHDLDGVLKTSVNFNFDPALVFFTSTELDFTLVALAPLSDTGVPLDRYGWLPLIPLSGKAADGEWVTVIQHPGSLPKQIAIHASQIIKLDQNSVRSDISQFIHYSTDTEPGSSGSPVLNDQWQVVAIHHKALADPKQDLTKPPQWIANEGIRVSAIYKHLERYRFEDPNAGEALDRLSRGLGFPPLDRPTTSAPSDPSAEKQYRAYKPDRWKQQNLGYDPQFLTTELAFEPIIQPLIDAEIVAPLHGREKTYELRYFHFSAAQHKDRRFPLITAVNIDGRRLCSPGDRKDTWRTDARIDEACQSDDAFYLSTLQDEAVYFSRGHLVRMLDPCWSLSDDPRQKKADARRAMEDTFHFTNAAPQVQSYNNVDWGNLEDYILDRAQTVERKLSVFTGPIFRTNDPLYGRKRAGGPWQIPLSYWKIAVLQKTDEIVSAAAFIVGQTDYVKALYEAKVFSRLQPYTIDEMRTRGIQTTIAAVEEETGLDFSAFRSLDAQGSLEATRRTRWVEKPGDVII